METVVVTGASSGIGRDAALHFTELGYRVFAGVRRLEDGRRVSAESARPELCVPLLLDVTDPALVGAAVRTVRSGLDAEGLTALVSNAGIAATGGAASCEECPMETQQRVMDVNFFGAARVIQAFLPLLRESRGTVVVNTALMAHTVLPFNGGYAASKWALEGWVDSLRREVGPLGVRVAMLEAGYISSELENKQVSAASSGVYPLEAGMHAAMTASAKRLTGRASASPRRMSEAMVRAVRADHPRPRRIVGTGAPVIWTIGCLPDRVQDRIFRAALPRLATRVPAPEPTADDSAAAEPRGLSLRS